MAHPKTRRATLTTTTESHGTSSQNLNLRDLKDTPHRYKFLLRFSLPLLVRALERSYGPKTTFVMTQEPTFADTGKTYTIKGHCIRPLHGKDNFFTQASDPMTLTFSLQMADAEKDGSSDEGPAPDAE